MLKRWLLDFVTLDIIQRMLFIKGDGSETLSTEVHLRPVNKQLKEKCAVTKIQVIRREDLIAQPGRNRHEGQMHFKREPPRSKVTDSAFEPLWHRIGEHLCLCR